MMKIGFLLPATMALDGPGNGVRAQAVYQMDALRALGHEVIGLDPWNLTDIGTLDIVQFFTGGFAMISIEHSEDRGVRNLVWAPMIDTNVSNKQYRIVTRVGNLHPKIHTIPGMFRKQALGCRLVICRSTHERDRVVSGLGIDPKTTGVEIVLNGVNPPAVVDPSPARAAFDLPDEFLLHVSAYTQGRKNVLRLMDAAGEAKLPLVIAGTAPPGKELQTIEEKAKRLGNVRLLGYQPRPMLESLFSACKVFCLPSEHEGTGLAALEAAACGAGVVITRNGGPPDYFGELGYYCDPTDTRSICDALQRAWKNPREKEIQQHVLTKLTWEKSAQCLADAYKRHCVF
jgi:glycosyltransferase involved in cell wall biosynthesis